MFAALFHEFDLASLSVSRFKNLLVVKIVDVLVISGNETRKRFLQERFHFHAKKVDSGKIGVRDKTIFVQCEIGDRSIVIQV